jgi:hypothetical protein
MRQDMYIRSVQTRTGDHSPRCPSRQTFHAQAIIACELFSPRTALQRAITHILTHAAHLYARAHALSIPFPSLTCIPRRKKKGPNMQSSHRLHPTGKPCLSPPFHPSSAPSLLSSSTLIPNQTTAAASVVCVCVSLREAHQQRISCCA